MGHWNSVKEKSRSGNEETPTKFIRKWYNNFPMEKTKSLETWEKRKTLLC